jgi:hypothetical protein
MNAAFSVTMFPAMTGAGEFKALASLLMCDER